MKVSEIINQIEKTANPATAASWDNSGMQVYTPRASVSHLAVMLDATPQTVRQALDAGAEMLLAHHPLAMQPCFPNAPSPYMDVLRMLIQQDVPLYSAHTSLDTNLCGPAGWLADALKLTNRVPVEVVAPREGAPLPYGYGIAGDLPEPLPYAALCETLAAAIGRQTWTSCGVVPSDPVTRVAYCTGSGSSMAQEAADTGATVYVTGDVKYHAALEAPIRILDVGHFILEEVMMQRFADVLRQACPNITVTFIPSEDPFAFEGASR